MIKILTTTKIREKYIIDGINDYSKRINKYNKIQSMTYKNIEQANKNSQGFIVLLDEKGTKYTSKEFAQLLKNKSITFIIGPPKGFEEYPAHDKKISFSKMTFPYQLISLILYEQIYRGYTILNNQKYHKE